MVVFGLIAGVISPITWGHHLVWLVLAGLYLALARPVWARVLGVGLVLACSMVSPLWAPDLSPAMWLRVAASLPLVICVVVICLGLPRRSPDDLRAEAPA